MDAIGGSGGMKIKTEWANNPGAPKQAEQQVKPERNLGERLNEMSGVKTVQDPYEQTKKKKLDKEAFLKMFMTQLKYQDPTSPVDNEKMAQQMAMFSQIEQSVTTNQYLEKILARQDDRSQLAFSMIGKEVSADKASIFHDRLAQTTINFDLPKDAGSLTVEILDEAGELVKTIPMDSHNEGPVRVRWDGTNDDNMPAISGRYFYNVKASDVGGQEIAIDKKLGGIVEGITKSGGETFLLVNGQKVSMNEVTTIKSAGEQSAQSNNQQSDGNVAGMKNEDKINVGQNANAAAKKVDAEISVSDEVAKALQGEDLIEEDRLNPMMPLFMR